MKQDFQRKHASGSTPLLYLESETEIDIRIETILERVKKAVAYSPAILLTNILCCQFGISESHDPEDTNNNHNTKKQPNKNKSKGGKDLCVTYHIDIRSM